MGEKSKKSGPAEVASSLGNPGTSRLENGAAKTEVIRDDLGFTPEEVNELFDQGIYPYQQKVSRQAYEEEKRLLQIELLKVQRWVKESGKRIVVIFEGRDAAGKGGTIKRFM